MTLWFTIKYFELSCIWIIIFIIFFYKTSHVQIIQKNTEECRIDIIYLVYWVIQKYWKYTVYQNDLLANTFANIRIPDDYITAAKHTTIVFYIWIRVIYSIISYRLYSTMRNHSNNNIQLCICYCYIICGPQITNLINF